MSYIDIKKGIMEVLETCGVILLDEDEDIPVDMDSLQWVTFVVELEEYFNITLEDEILVQNSVSLENVIDIVEQSLNA